MTAQSTWKKSTASMLVAWGAQELPPCGVDVSHRRRWDAVAFEDPPDRRGADPAAEFEQLALDPLVSPVRVVRCRLHDQRGESAADRWASASVRIGPFLADETAMPAQDRVRGDRRWRRNARGSRRTSAARTARSARSRSGLWNPARVETRTLPSRRLQSAHAATRRRLSINSGDGEKSDDHADDRRRHYRSSDSALLLKDGHRWVCWGGGSSRQG